MATGAFSVGVCVGSRQNVISVGLYLAWHAHIYSVLAHRVLGAPQAVLVGGAIACEIVLVAYFTGS